MCKFTKKLMNKCKEILNIHESYSSHSMFDKMIRSNRKNLTNFYFLYRILDIYLAKTHQINSEYNYY